MATSFWAGLEGGTGHESPVVHSVTSFGSHRRDLSGVHVHSASSMLQDNSLSNLICSSALATTRVQSEGEPFPSTLAFSPKSLASSITRHDSDHYELSEKDSDKEMV